MAAAPILEAQPILEVQGPSNDLVYAEGVFSQNSFLSYLDLRKLAAEVDKPTGDELSNIQSAASKWVIDERLLEVDGTIDDVRNRYTKYDRTWVEGKIWGLIDFLRANYSRVVPEEELEASEAFLASAFAMYDDQPTGSSDVMVDADGSFAFVVPARMSRNNPEYGQEVEPIIPTLRYLPNEMRAQMMVGLPPFVIDTYHRDSETGKRGYLIFAPVYGDMVEELTAAGGSRSDQLEAARGIVNDTVDFARRRFGVSTVGLGATLPSLTNYGRTINNPGVVTTTGHGGTAELISRTMLAGLHGKSPSSIGVLGTGAIGGPVADVVAQRFPNAVPINIYDTDTRRTASLNNKHLGRFTVAESGAALIENSQVILSAMVGSFDAVTNGIKDMHGKIVVDDAQPASFDPAQVEALGGKVLWVIGKDTRGLVVRDGYNYATMLDDHTDLFGCEAEAAVLEAYRKDLESRGMGEALAEAIVGKVAIRRAVTAQAVRYVSALFKRFGIEASQPQAFGKAVDLGDVA